MRGVGSNKTLAAMAYFDPVQDPLGLNGLFLDTGDNFGCATASLIGRCKGLRDRILRGKTSGGVLVPHPRVMRVAEPRGQQRVFWLGLWLAWNAFVTKDFYVARCTCCYPAGSFPPFSLRKTENVL